MLLVCGEAETPWQGAHGGTKALTSWYPGSGKRKRKELVSCPLIRTLPPVTLVPPTGPHLPVASQARKQTFAHGPGLNYSSGAEV